MKPLWLRLAATSCLLLAAISSYASSRPRYGGAVRIVMRDHVNTLDPAADDDHPAARDRVSCLLFETLTTMDGLGHLHPGLAVSWFSDPSKRVWHFHLRLARFHDASPVTANDVVVSLS